MAGEPGTPSKIIAFMHWGAVSRFFLMLLTATVFSLLRRLFDRVKKGDAFTMKSVGLVRLMGWSFFAYLALQTVYENLFAWIVSRDLSLSELTTRFRSAGTGEPVRFVLLNHHLNLDLTAAFFGLFALALAEVIRQGLLLKEENDLTV